MDTTVYNMPDGRYIRRVDRRTARKLYDAGKPVWAQACKLSPNGVWSLAFDATNASGEAFEQFENAFAYYNCTPETGRRVAWYAQEGARTR